MRVEILLGGTDPGRLGSPRDVTLRSVLSKMKLAETHKLMVMAAAATNNIDTTQKSLRKYSAAIWYEDHTENKYQEMQAYYQNNMKHQKVQAVMKGKSIEVTGIN